MTDGAAILRALAEAMRETPIELPDGVPDPAAATVRIANGIPALTGEPLVGWAGLVRNASGLARALADTAAGDSAGCVLQGLTAAGTGLDPESTVQIALGGAWDAVPDLAVQLQVDTDALLTMLDYSARPALRAAAAAVGPVLAGASWGRGRCPACGAPPALSVVSGKERDRRLYCARCATAWAYPRLRCPGCGEANHERLGYVHAAGEGEYRRVEVCESCRGYLKSLALLDAPQADRLLQLDLETVALDFLALDQGYARI